MKYPKWLIYATSVQKTELSNLTKNEIVLPPKHGAPPYGQCPYGNNTFQKKFFVFSRVTVGVVLRAGMDGEAFFFTGRDLKKLGWGLRSASPSKFGGCQSKDIFKGLPVQKITLYVLLWQIINFDRKETKYIEGAFLCFIFFPWHTAADALLKRRTLRQNIICHWLHFVGAGKRY